MFDQQQQDLTDFKLWEHFIFGTFSIDTVLRVVKDPKWQRTRVSMLSTTLQFKWNTLEEWLANAEDENDLWKRRVQVTNYVYALKRGGLIK